MICGRFTLSSKARQRLEAIVQHEQVYGQGEGGPGEIIYSEDMCPELAARVVGFWRSHPLAAAAGVSLFGSEGDTAVVERLDERTRG